MKGTRKARGAAAPSAAMSPSGETPNLSSVIPALEGPRIITEFNTLNFVRKYCLIFVNPI